ncbi:MAG: cysteine--tRNA ligase [Pseudomonadota bacterium]|nr:cysteine--tRNA ligase [Pseudomonadota bacterium]
MRLFLHNTLTGNKIEFKPLDPKKVKMYLCGPTVYNYAHIGNARPAVVFDLLVRILRLKYKLIFARNLTDVDDKINAAAIKSKRSIGDITEEYIFAYNKDMNALGVQMPDIEPRATENISEMISMIESLILKGHAYEADGHVLFNVGSYKKYGALSRRNLKEMIAGSRVDIAPYKKQPQDFILWKPSTSDLPGWDSPWGRGRPGWHLECSAMIKKYLGETIDIHAGGQDLVFPHHENEIAQSTCVHDGREFSRYWLHNGFLSIENKKMSKSLGNFSLVRDLLEYAPGEAIRLALLSAHYRQPLEWSTETIASAKQMLDRMYGALREISISKNMIENTDIPSSVLEALCDDLNTPKAIAEIFKLVKKLNKAKHHNDKELLAAAIYVSGNIMGLLGSSPDQWFSKNTDNRISEEEIEELIAQREKARAEEDFDQADSLRKQIEKKGITLEDTSSGVRWHFND